MKSNLWRRFLDVKSSKDIELKRKKFVLYFASYFGGLVILFFAAQNYNSEYKVLSWVLIVSAIVIFSNAVVSHFINNFYISCYIGSACIAFLMLELLVSGGYANTALYWMYPFPLVFFTLLNYRYGLIVNLLLFAIITFLLYHPELLIAQYRVNEISRFIASFLITILIAFLSEYFRYHSQKELCDINVEKQRQANTDPLTGLANRRFLESVFFDEAKQSPMNNFPLTIVAADIDHFKKVNDNFGHDVGDKVLCYMANYLKGHIRESDFAIRTGGEEFLLVLPKTSIESGVMVAEKIRLLIAKSHYLEKDNTVDNAIDIQLTMSFGVTMAHAFDEINLAIKQADALLYHAKTSGRNRVESTS